MLSAAIAAASLALADAGAELIDLAPASTVALLHSADCAEASPPLSEGERIVQDPTEEEERRAAATLLLARLPSRDAIGAMQMRGAIDPEALGDAVGLAGDGCARLHAKMRECLLASMVASG